MNNLRYNEEPPVAAWVNPVVAKHTYPYLQGQQQAYASAGILQVTGPLEAPTASISKVPGYLGK